MRLSWFLEKLKSLSGNYRRKPLNVFRGKFVDSSHPFLREGGKFPVQEVFLVYAHGGMGDYIYWTRAIEWVIREHEWLVGEVWVPRYFYDLAELWLRPHLGERFKLRRYEKLEEEREWIEGSKFFVVPDAYQMATYRGHHLMDIGFSYYGDVDVVPDGYARMPVIRGDEVSLARYELPKRYVVVTTEATSIVRRMKADEINKLCEYLKGRGYLPVFLGKGELAHDYVAYSDNGVRVNGVYDLRERTTLLEAACILAKSSLVCGVDNGLLHLASCSRVPVIFGFTTVDPRHRGPLRNEGLYTAAVMPSEELKCRFCQSRVRYLLGHDFRNCIYGDVRCLDYMNAGAFIKIMDKVLA
jgi:hypothetical protein